jgi:hypothetical protein
VARRNFVFMHLKDTVTRLARSAKTASKNLDDPKKEAVITGIALCERLQPTKLGECPNWASRST